MPTKKDGFSDAGFFAPGDSADWTTFHVATIATVPDREIDLPRNIGVAVHLDATGVVSVEPPAEVIREGDGVLIVLRVD